MPVPGSEAFEDEECSYRRYIKAQNTRIMRLSRQMKGSRKLWPLQKGAL